MNTDHNEHRAAVDAAGGCYLGEDESFVRFQDPTTGVILAIPTFVFSGLAVAMAMIYHRQNTLLVGLETGPQ